MKRTISRRFDLLSAGGDAKTRKGQGTQGILTGILYLAPAFEAGPVNVCPWASDGCISGCLYKAGHGGFSSVQTARIRKTRDFLRDRAAFSDRICRDVEKVEKLAAKHGMQPAIRLNGTSDLPWEKTVPMDAFPGVAWYDYTKSPERMAKFLAGGMPANYHLTFSRSEANERDALALLPKGGNVAAVFATKKADALPATWKGFRVIDADKDDVRFNDPRGVIAGLRAKGPARKDASGFVIHLN